MFVARLLECGFLLPAEPTGPDTTEDRKFRLLRLAGIDQTLSYFRVSLTNRASAILEPEVIVIFVHYPALTDAAVASVEAVLAPQFPDRLLAFVREDREGWARATYSETRFDPAVAAAVAMTKTVAAWDESSAIVVQIAANELEVAMEYADQQWFATAALREPGSDRR